MSPIKLTSPADVFPKEAIQALRRTGPWLLFVAIITTIVAVASLCFSFYFSIMPSKANALSYMAGSQTESSVALLIIYGLLEALLAVMMFRAAYRLPSLSVFDTSQLSIDLDQICRRQLQLWATLAIFSGIGLATGLFYLIEFASHTAW